MASMDVDEDAGARAKLRSFVIGKAVGKGKFSVVYKAERRDTGELRALKRGQLVAT